MSNETNGMELSVIIFSVTQFLAGGFVGYLIGRNIGYKKGLDDFADGINTEKGNCIKFCVENLKVGSEKERRNE
jgi:hypothetical protein